MRYFLGNAKAINLNNRKLLDITFKILSWGNLKLITSKKNKFLVKLFCLLYPNSYNVSDSYYNDGYEWIKIYNSYYSKFQPKNIKPMNALNTLEKLSNLKNQNDYENIAIFGTGPSLTKFGSHDFSKSFSILSNIGALSDDIILHVKPKIVVAGDAIYHFGASEYAILFRKKLRKILERYNLLFAYPEVFHLTVREKICGNTNQLLPLAVDRFSKDVTHLQKRGKLPNQGNVLNLLLLPLAHFMNKGNEIKMLGFDGKALGDKAFWKNYEIDDFNTLKSSIEILHPAFFLEHLKSEFHYQEEYMEKILDKNLKKLEKLGYKIFPLNDSNLRSLQKRRIT